MSVTIKHSICDGLGIVQSEPGQSQPGKSDAESLQRRAPRDGLSHAFGEFIELVVHTFPFVFGLLFCFSFQNSCEAMITVALRSLAE